MKKRYFTFKRTISIVLLITMLLSLSGFDRISPYLNGTAKAATTTTASSSKHGNIKLKELVNKRTEYSKTYLNTDGTETIQLYTYPIFYENETGSFEEIDNSLVETTDSTLKSSYPYENKANKYKVHFSKKSNGNSLYKFSYGKYSVDIIPVDCNKVEGIYDNDTMLYKNIYDGVDLEYVPLAVGYKENIVINEYTGKYTFDFQISLKNLVPVPSDNGTILLNDSETNETISVFTTPFMDDAAGETSGDVIQKITRSKGNGKYILTITASKDWLESNDRVYPVKIDPTVTTSTIDDSFIYSAYPSYNYYNNHDLRVGYSSSVGIARSYVKFTSLPVVNGYITDAKFYAYCNYSTTSTGANIELHEVITDWTYSGICWNSRPRFNDVVTDTVSNITSNGYYSWNMTDLVRAWYCGRANYGFMLKDDTENDRYRIFYSSNANSYRPYLEITYTTLYAPTASVVGGAVNSSQGYINLSWSAVSGATGYNALIYNGYNYQSYSADSSTSWTTNGKGIFPTSSQLAAGQWQFLTNGTGGQLSDDPRKLYTNAYNAHSSSAGQFSDYRNVLYYALRYQPYRTFTIKTVDGSASSTQTYTYSCISEAATPTLPDRTAPPAPTLVSIKGTDGAANSGDAATVTVTWNSSTDYTTGSNSGVASYSVNMYKASAGSNPYSGTLYNTVSTTGNSLTLSSQSDYSTYGFTVRAVDKNGNYSSYTSSSSLTWTSADTTPPTGPTTISINPTTWARSITLNWSGASDSESGLSDIQYMVDSGTWTSIGSNAASGNKVLTGLTAGQHTLYVRAKDAAGNYTLNPQSVTYYYDSEPFIQITSPSAGSYVSGTINITGSATDTYFKNYVVEYSLQSANSWTTIGSAQTTQVSNGTLATLDTTALADGVYKIRLTASDNAGSTSVTVQNITIDNTTESNNASITAPTANALVDGTVDIWGTAFETNFSSAKLEYGASSSPTTWTTIATLSSAVKTNSKLASWDTSSLSAGVYTIRLTVTDKTNHTVTKTVQVTILGRTFVNNLGTSGYNPTADLALGSVNTVNGNFILGVTDLSVAQGKGPAINVSRTYNSLNKTTGLFGWGWTISIPTLTVNDNNSVDIITGDGYKLHYIYDSATGSYKEATGNCTAPLSYSTLTYDSASGIYTLSHKDGSKTIFDNANRKVYEKDSLGNALTYAIGNNKITITDAVSRTVTLNIDTTYNRITSMTDFNVTGQGTRTWTYEYDKYGNLVTVTAPGNRVTKYTYSESNHNLLTVTSPNETAALAADSSYHVKNYIYTYDGYKLATATDKLGIVTNISYDTANNLTTVTEYYGMAEPKTLKYYYDSYGRLTKLTDALKDTIYTYGDSANPYLSTNVEKKSGATLLESESYTYDSNGNTLTYIDKSGLTTTYTYINNHLATITDSKGNVTTYTYSDDGAYNLISDGSNTYTYYELGSENNGALKTEKDSDGNILTYEYTNGYVTKITKNENTTEESTYDEAGRLLTKVSDGKITEYQYTIFDKVSQITETEGEISSITSYTYDSEGNLLKEISPDGITTEYLYDAMGNLLKTTVTGSDNTTKSITTYAYDHSNGITTVTDTEGNTVTYDYDNSTGLLTKYTDAKGNYKTYTYDALGRTKTVTGTTVVGGTLGNIVNQYTYDGDNVTSITHNGFSYIFGYDQYGHKTSVAIGNSNLEVQSTLVTYGYDDTNNKDLLTSIQYANNQTIGYSYNSDSKLTSTSYNGIVKFEYQYDTANNTETIIDKVNNVTYTVRYDDNDRITSITGTDGSLIQYQYKDENIVSSITSTINGTTKTTSYSYDENDKLIGVTTVNGSTISYSYDSLSRTDKKEITLSNGTYTTSYTYIGGENDTTTGKVASINNNGTVTEYAYDANGNITSITSNGKTITYTYNSLDELVREDNQVLEKTIVYSYDAGGNILSKTEYPYTTSDILGTPINTITYTYDTVWKDKLVEYNGKPITYDDAGNTLTYDGYTFTWEAGRQLAAISGNGQTISYKYNDSGYRTEKTANGVTTKYYLDGDKVILEENGSDSIYYSYDADDKLVSMTLNGTEYFYIRNSQGDITGLIDTEGTQVVSYTYDSWGKLVSIDGSLKDTVGLQNPYRYRGYRYDTETGLYSLHSRYYDPEIGRFINADAPETMFVADSFSGTNLYAYCYNNPVNMVDHSGMIPDWVITGVIHLKLTMTPWGWAKYYAAKTILFGAGNAFLAAKGYSVARALYNHGMWGYGTAISQSTKDLIIKTLKNSSYFNDQIKKSLNGVRGTSVNKLKVSMNFTSGDLLYGIGKIDFYLTGSKKNGKWTVTVTGSDIYNFDNIRSFSKLSFGNAVNDLGWAMQKLGMIVPFEWSVSFSYTY